MAPATETMAEPNEIVCYSPTMITTNGIWQGDNPLDFSFPLFILQMMLIVVTTRTLVYLLRPIRQPRVIAEIMAGILLGPSILGRNKNFAMTIFPLRSVMVLETMANIGLIYFLFLIGVEMDISVIKQTGRKSINIAIGGMLIPFATGCVFSLFNKDETKASQACLALFLGVALAVTAFPVLARILAELKLLNTDLGKIALSAALVNDIIAWSLLALGIALTETDTSSVAFFGVILSSTVFVLVCVFVVRPMILWMIRSESHGGENFNEVGICFILTGVLIAGFIADAIGTHSIFGAFVFGLVIPSGPLAVALIEKIEDFVSGILLPLFFAISGLKTNMNLIRGANTWGYLAGFVTISCLGKIGGTMVVSYLYQMPVKEGFSLGLLMNTKGLVEMIILNVGKDQKVFDDESFAVLVTTSVVITAIVIPIVTTIYRPTRRFVAYKRRTLQTSKPDAELRLITCIHTPRNVPAIINLLVATNPTKRSPLCVYALHLVELAGRTSAMLIVDHNTRRNGKPAMNRTQAQTDHIINALENYERYADNVSVQPLTVVSPYATMHEDVCNLTVDKRVALMIIPFHKQQTVDGGMDATIPAFQMVNQNILENAPCSVGVFVDRGLTGSTRIGSTETTHHIAVLFFGGPDDREALAYAWRMSDNPSNIVNVIRFLAREELEQPELTIVNTTDDEKQIDQEYINEFRAKTSNNEFVTYKELIVNNGEETVDVIRSIDTIHDLFIVGRGQGMVCPLTAGLTAWSECPELGPIGDLLAAADFASSISVLVLQQFVGMESQGNEAVTPNCATTNDFSIENRLDPWEHVNEWQSNHS